MSTESVFIEQYRLLHQRETYGISSQSLFHQILPYAEDLKPRTILDYGCGRSNLVDMLAKHIDGISAYRYDPAIPEFDQLKVEHVDLVINTDVLEHIPEECVGDVVKRVSRLSDRVFFNIHLAAAIAVLPNGSNAHCLIRPLKWWKQLLENYFERVDEVFAPKKQTVSFITWEPLESTKLACLKYKLQVQNMSNVSIGSTVTKEISAITSV